MTVAVSDTELSLSWATPTSCSRYGGVLLGYQIQYQYRLQGSSAFVTDQVNVSTESASGYTLPNLMPATSYQIRVAARNAIGVGPAAVVMETTNPLVGKYQLIGCSSVLTKHFTQFVNSVFQI